MDDIEVWSGCSYIQLKEMPQDREQWRRKAIEWSSAVANRHRRWSTSEWVSDRKIKQESCAVAKITARCKLAYTSGSNEPLRRWPFEIIQDVTGNSAIRSADPENPTLEPNMKCIGSPVAEIWPFAYLWMHIEPPFWGRGGRRGQRWHH